MLKPATFVLAFCSMVYELLLSQTLAAFLGNTVLRYSVTVGLYMLSMGIGALLVQRTALRRPLFLLQGVEVGLTLLGGASVVSLFLLDAWGLPHALLSLLGHTYIVAIGVLTGLELPLLIELARRAKGIERDRVLGVDYLGAFAGTLAFAFYFYPEAGLIPTALSLATLNALVGLSLVRHLGSVRVPDRAPHRRLAAIQAVLLCAGFVCLLNARTISERCIELYLGGAA